MYSEEILGGIGSGIIPGSGILGSLAAAITPTLTDAQMASQDRELATNVVPGIGTYRSWKRSGYYDKKLQKELDRRKIKEIAQQVKENSKKAALTSEILGSMADPLNLVAAPIAGIAAALTPTKTHEQMLEQQGKRWSNLLPGVGPYRYWKRKGYENAAAEQMVKDIAARAHKNKSK